MFFKLLLLFTAVPLIELMLLIRIGEIIGITYTVLLVIFTGVTGVSIARNQGYQVIRKIRSDLNSSKLPADEMVGALLILIGGIMLLTPGILTDFCGFALILPPTRKIAVKYVKERFIKYIKNNKVNVYYNDNSYEKKSSYEYEDDINNEEFIDIEYEDVEIDKDSDKNS